jgi:hypothetical protein
MSQASSWLAISMVTSLAGNDYVSGRKRRIVTARDRLPLSGSRSIGGQARCREVDAVAERQATGAPLDHVAGSGDEAVE